MLQAREHHATRAIDFERPSRIARSHRQHAVRQIDRCRLAGAGRRAERGRGARVRHGSGAARRHRARLAAHRRRQPAGQRFHDAARVAHHGDVGRRPPDDRRRPAQPPGRRAGRSRRSCCSASACRSSASVGNRRSGSSRRFIALTLVAILVRAVPDSRTVRKLGGAATALTEFHSRSVLTARLRLGLPVVLGLRAARAAARGGDHEGRPVRPP